MKKILCIGPQWRGSNAGGLFRSFARTGSAISVIDENYYINLKNRSFVVKALDRIFRSFHIKEFNKAIIDEFESFVPDLVLVYKGAFVLPETIRYIKNKKVQVVVFYPDVSFRTHGSLLAQTLPLYDHVFTTKTFGIHDMQEQLRISDSSFIPHGFDPDIHRKIEIKENTSLNFNCDVSFIGGWSEKKERQLAAIREALPDIEMKIWGGRWESCKNPSLLSSIQYKSVLGDLYTLCIRSSNINLGLLHERVEGASSGDLITSRTFHIPGAGGFMIHERTVEIGNYFKEDEEIVCFETEAELVAKVNEYLNKPELRNKIAQKGYERAQRDHSLDQRAQQILAKLI